MADKRDNALRKILGNMGVVTVCNIIALVGMMWRTFLLASTFDLENFGRVIICLNFFAVVKMLAKPGLGFTLQKYIPEYDHQGASDRAASLCWLCAYLSILVAIPIMLGGVVAIPWIAEHWYDDCSIIFPMQVMAFTSAFFLLGDIASMLLRLVDAFIWALLPMTLAAVAVPLYLVSIDGSSFTVSKVVVAIAASEFFILLALLCALLIKTKKYWKFSRKTLSLAPLRGQGKEIKSILTHTSVFGILRGGSESVAAFLIGVFAGAKDIAVIGMGIQLAKPITFIQASVGSVIGPEISTLYAKGRYGKVMQLLNKTIIVGGLALVGGLLFSYLIGPWLITRYLGEAYLQAMPVFYMLATSYMLIVMFTGFLPISIARGEIKRRNLVVSIRFLYLGVAVAIGLNAWNAAFVQLLGALTIRVFNDWPLYRSLNNEMHPRLKS